jgi:SNF2 family DNA or RNA helicase
MNTAPRTSLSLLERESVLDLREKAAECFSYVMPLTSFFYFDKVRSRDSGADASAQRSNKSILFANKSKFVTDSDVDFLMELMRCKPARAVQLPKVLRCRHEDDSSKFPLRSYQQDGINWLVFLQEHNLHGILADDMGLGKTLQTLCAIAIVHNQSKERLAPSIVVCPSSLVMHWKQEFDRFFSAPAPDGWNLKAAVYSSQDFACVSAQHGHEDESLAHLYIVSYGTVTREFGVLSKSQREVVH